MTCLLPPASLGASERECPVRVKSPGLGSDAAGFDPLLPHLLP